MDVLEKVAGKPSWLTAHVVAMLFVAVASCGAAFAQTQRTGGPTPSAPGADLFRSAEHGCCTRRIGPRELGPSPSAR